MTDPVIDALNQLCKQLFEAADSNVRLQAERNLAEFQESPECLRRCMMLLENGELPYAPIVASTTLMKVVSAKNTPISIDQKLELSRYLLTVLGQRAPQFEAYTVTGLCQVFARITKQEWSYVIKTGADEDAVETPFREPAFALLKTINIEHVEESLLALQLLNTLVTDMNSDAGVETLNKQRRNAAQFREEILYQMFKFSLDFLWEQVVQVDSVSEVKLPLIYKVLDLSLNCMLFDFVGMSGMDDPGDENTNVQVPNSWKTLFTDGRPANMIYKLYNKMPQDASEKVLHFGVQIASVRRSFFTQPERQIYMEPLVLSVRQIIEDPNKLSDPTAFHQFARMIVRIKTNYQLYELMYSKDYPNLIRSLAEFTVQSLLMPELSSNSIYFLLMFWSRMVASVPYNRGTEDHLLNIYVPEIFKTYVESRLQNVERVLTQGAEDPLEDQGSIVQTMEFLAVICRIEYEKSYLLLTGLFDENARVLQNTPADDMRAKIAKGRLIWLITFMGTAVYGKILVTTPDDMDKWDGDMVARCINIMRISDQRLSFPSAPQSLPENGCERLEVSFIYLLECFRKVYIFSAGKCNSPVYDKMSSDAGIPDETAMTGFISQKVINNLRFWALNENVLELTLDMFKELSHGYSAVRKLIKLPEIQVLLNNHTPENFAFLGPDISYETMKSRTVFYDSITRILFVDLNEDDDVFKQYMSPFSSTVDLVVGVINGTPANLSVDQLQRMIVGLCRDLRGVALACTSKTTYQMLFDWMYPNVFKIMLKCVEEWTDHREVILSVFRLLEELCQNRQERLKFELNSCSAVLMFKETSKIITEYGARYLHLPPVAKDNVYKQRYKVVASVFRCIKYTLVGAYIPFGVFRLYGDWCLRDVLMTFVKFFRTIPEEDIAVYPKLSEAYYTLLENVVHTNMPFMSNIEPDNFTCILRSISAGVTSMNSTVSTSSCSALDDVLTYLYKRLTRPARPFLQSVGADPEGDQCMIAMEKHPDVLADMLTSMMSALVFNEVKCQWSMSRPLLGLILLQEEVFENYKRQLIQTIPSDRQQVFGNMFEGLMQGVDRSLTVKNKDNFTHNLHKFRRDIMDVLKMGPPQTTASGENSTAATNISDPSLVDMS